MATTSNPSNGSLAALLAAAARLSPEENKMASKSIGNSANVHTPADRLVGMPRPSPHAVDELSNSIIDLRHMDCDQTVLASNCDSWVQNLLRDRHCKSQSSCHRSLPRCSITNTSKRFPSKGNAFENPHHGPIPTSTAAIQSCLLRNTPPAAVASNQLMPRVVSDESTVSTKPLSRKPKATYTASLNGGHNAVFPKAQFPIASPHVLRKKGSWGQKPPPLHGAHNATFPKIPSLKEKPNWTTPFLNAFSHPPPSMASAPLRRPIQARPPPLIPHPPSPQHATTAVPYPMAASLLRDTLIGKQIVIPTIPTKESLPKTERIGKSFQTHWNENDKMVYENDIVLAAIGGEQDLSEDAQLDEQISRLMDQVFEEVEKEKVDPKSDRKRMVVLPPNEKIASMKRPRPSSSKDAILLMSLEDLKKKELRKGYGKRWIEMYNRLLVFQKAHNGSTDVPKFYDKDKQLGSWVRVQNRAYKKNELSPERKRLLDAIGFSLSQDQRVQRKDLYDRYDARWDEMFRKLLAYKIANDGSTNVPKRYAVDIQLGTWVSNQRNFFRTGKLTEVRKNRLNAVGFQWKVKS